MIHLIRINDSEFVLNAELIEMVESSPDTIVSLANGHKYLVKDSVDEVIRKVVEYKQSILTKSLKKE